MASIRIINTPAGEAPEAIRQAWVGLVLPLAEGRFGHRNKWLVSGVLSGPKNWIMSILSLLRGRYETHDGYAVDANTAIKLLADSNSAAAQWWYENTPHLLKPNRRLIFEAGACEELS